MMASDEYIAIKGLKALYEEQKRTDRINMYYQDRTKKRIAIEKEYNKDYICYVKGVMKWV